MNLTWTDQPERSLWDQIMVYGHEGNVKSLLTNRVTRRRIHVANQEKIDEKSREAAFSIQQAHEYFLAAKSVTVTTSPLLYYYGMLSLVKALVVCNSPRHLLDDIKYHGLKTKGTQHSNSSSNSLELGEQKAWVDGGAFTELFNLLRPESAPSIKGTCFRLADIFRVDPQMTLLFDRQFHSSSGCISHYRNGENEDGSVYVEVHSGQSEINSRIPQLQKITRFTEGSIPSVTQVTANVGNVISEFASVYRIRAGGKVLRANPTTTDNAGQLSSTFYSVEECDFIAMFILSDCVRYKQELWRRCQIAGDDACYPLVGSFITNAIRRFPNFFLDHLLGEPHEFGSAAFWT